jgi:predicted glycosyltransferase involved in capsule biosynthesis
VYGYDGGAPVEGAAEDGGYGYEDIDMIEDMTTEVEVEVVEREHEGVTLARHWIGDRAERHR